MKKKLKLTGLLGSGSLLVLTACGTSQVTAQSTGGWERFVYFFAEAIRFLSFSGSIGVGIIVLTIVIRTVLLPLFQYQMNSNPQNAGNSATPSSRNCKLWKYPGKGILDSRTKLSEEMGPHTRKRCQNVFSLPSSDPDAGLDGLVPSA